MLTDLEAGLLELLLTQYLDQHAEQMQRDVPIPYVVLRSAQRKLQEMSPRRHS